jgi:3-hydroxybutyryl-CoA dehydrogenase
MANVNVIGVVGGGVMGGGIAQVLAVAGYRVVVRDLTQAILDQTREEICDRKWGVKRAVEKGKLGFDLATAALQRITYTTKLEDLADCDFVIEAVPERLELKQQVFKELDALVRKHAILVSNTSGIVIAEIARDCSEERRKRICGMHFFNPVPVMRLVEIITTPDTSADTIDTVREVSEKAGKVTAMVKDTPGTRGFIVNRIYGVAAREARKLVEDGIATPEDIDKAMINGRNWPAGFFGGRGGIGKQW